MRGVSNRSGCLLIGDKILAVSAAARYPPSRLLPPLRRLRPLDRRIVAAFDSGMASPQRNNGGETTKGLVDEKEEAKGNSPPPPPLQPPEKPLPGDCCGSGCVRCVWDVYYEELEAYNKSISADEGDH